MPLLLVGTQWVGAAAYLARAGLEVLVLERRHVVGGACTTEEIFPGYHISTCSFIVHILQDKIVRDLDLYKHGYHVQALDPERFFPYLIIGIYCIGAILSVPAGR